MRANGNCGLDPDQASGVVSLDAALSIHDRFAAANRARSIDSDSPFMAVLTEFRFRYCVVWSPLWPRFLPPRNRLVSHEVGRYVG